MDENNNVEEKKEKQLSLSSGIIIAIVTFAGYSMAFSYEAGYCRYFNIPLSLISVNYNTILKSLLTLIIFLGIIFVLFNYYCSFFPEKKNNFLFKKIFKDIFFILFLVLPFLYIYRDLPKSNIYGILIVVSIFPIADFLFPIFGKGKYLEKLENQEKIEGEIARKGLFYKFEALFGRRAVMFFIIAVYIIMLSFYYGKTEAQRQKYFFLTGKNKEFVVLRIYDDKILMAPFDKNIGLIKDPLKMLNYKNENEISLFFEEIGRLKEKN